MVTSSPTPIDSSARSLPLAFLVGAVVGTMGGLIGLGGAEFRLPLLIGVFGFFALHAVILNKAMSLVVVATAIPARLMVMPLDQVGPHWYIVVNLLIGTFIGAWVGATWATKIASHTLYRVLGALLLFIAVLLAVTHLWATPSLDLVIGVQWAAGIVAGFVIGIVAALMGVAGGELLIPTLVLLYGIDIRTAGTLSLLVSLPTMLVAFARYSRDDSFGVLRRHPRFLIAMTLGSITGTFIGAVLAGVVPVSVIVPLLVALLVFSAWKVWNHKEPPTQAAQNSAPA